MRLAVRASPVRAGPASIPVVVAVVAVIQHGLQRKQRQSHFHKHINDFPRIVTAYVGFD